MFNYGNHLMPSFERSEKSRKPSSIEIFEDWAILFEEENYTLLNQKISDGILNPHNPLINGLTPLHIACIQGNITALRFLLKYNVDVNVESNIGRTALDEALFYKYFNCVIELMKKEVRITPQHRKVILNQMV
jgi:ankyrin repeat protein